MNDSAGQSLFEKRVHLWRKHGFKLLSIGLSLIALVTASVIHSNADQAFTTAKAMLQQQQAVNSEADQAAIILNQNLTSYHALQARQVIAAPERLQWLEVLQTTVTENLLPKVSFALAPTAPASSTNTIYTDGTIGAKVTPMRLEFTVLHEGDLLRLLNDVHTQANGLFSVESCELGRNEEHNAGEDASSSYVQMNFKGYCELLWYSLADITSAWEAPNAPQ